METYTTKEVAEILQVSDRTVRRYLNSYYSTEKGTITVSKKMLELLKKEHNTDNQRTELSEAPGEEFDIIEGFTNEEYQEFQKRLTEHPFLKQELEYHKRSAESHQRQMEMILNVFNQRNILEAINKKND